MSAITPLLDTLLHNVLGRRADLDRVASRQPDLPLGGVTYTPPVRHGTSDTPDETLERHSEDAAARARAAEKTSARAVTLNSSPSPEEASSNTALKSSATHFSAEARAISRILEKFPATAPVVSTGAVLLPDTESPRASALASTLAGQIRHSGLFYESHLRQWLVGQHDHQELLKEPQNRMLQPTMVANPAGNGADKATAALVTAMRERGAAHSESTLSTQNGVAADLSSAQDDLQGILRHQLELMTTSLIRWEGFLTPQVPVQWEIEHETGGSNGESTKEASRVWRSKLKLVLPALGHVDLEISLQDKTINVSGRVEGPYLAWMTVQGRYLDERLADAGLQLAALHFSPQSSNDHGEEAT